ncbi:amino acid transporter [Caulobacter ginsengisoli]|uniref:Amino acid transporter n=1 Tax=Caulobacter ginsengisoli TaxID=400775 RepID=A0ABU0IQR0_9CAUL|nr:APC family permease [Caulobacter ginsengisoli]MDQ0464351.1 amino acid transporter [Caulobacter ginsengisoli]
MAESNHIVGAAGEPGVEAFGYKQELKRALSLWDLLFYGLVFISPIAPFGVFGFVYNASHGMPPLVYAVGLIAMLFTAFSYVAMSRAFPVAGSVYAYAGRGIGESAGFLAGWAILLDYLLLPTLVYVGASVTMTVVLPGVPKPVWVVVFLVFNTVVNLIGIETTALLNKILLALQIMVLAVFVGFAVYGLQHGVAGAHLSWAPLWDSAKVTPALVFGALSFAALSFLGFDAISTLSEEAKGGARSVGWATILSLVLAATLFIGQTYLASLFVLGRDHFPPGDGTANAFLTVANIMGGPILQNVTAVLGLLLSALAGALAAQAATARLLYSMARDGKLPRFLAHVDARRKTPQRAVLLVAAITLLLGLAMVDHLQLIISLVNFGALFGFLTLHLSVVWYFLIRRRTGRWFAHLLSPALGFAVIAYVLYNADHLAKIAGLTWLAVGVVVLVVLKLKGQSAALPVDEV